MDMPPLEVSVLNHQRKVVIPEPWLDLLEQAARWSVLQVAAAGQDSPALAGLAGLDVSLLDDAAIGEVHGRFLGDPTPTDVITFDHGEILIGAETAWRQAAEYGEPLARELVRYLVHGILHLAGHDDRGESDRRVMETEQERIVAAVWRDLGPADPQDHQGAENP